MTRLPPPAWLRAFEAAARRGGFAAAAQELGLTPTAVSQQIRALEGHLGLALFHRLPRGVALTEMGQAYLPSVRRAFDDLATATAGLFGAGQVAPVVVRAPPSFAALRLAPLLPAFQAAHCEIPLRLSTAIWADAAPEDGVDVDIRHGDGRFGNGRGTRALSAPVSVLVCHPADAGAELADHAARAIHVAGCESLWQRLAAQEGLAAARIGQALAADSSLVALELVAAGLGAALVACDLAAPAHAAGRVAEPGPMLETGQAHHVALTRRGAERPEARVFRDWLVAEMADGEGLRPSA